MGVVPLKRPRVIRSRIVRRLVPAGELAPSQREFMVQAFGQLRELLCARLADQPDDRTLADLWDAVGAVRDLSLAVLEEPAHVGLCRLELAKQLADLQPMAGRGV